MEKGGAVKANTKQMMRFTTKHNATFSVDGLEFLTGDRYCSVIRVFRVDDFVV